MNVRRTVVYVEARHARHYRIASWVCLSFSIVCILSFLTEWNRNSAGLMLEGLVAIAFTSCSFFWLRHQARIIESLTKPRQQAASKEATILSNSSSCGPDEMIVRKDRQDVSPSSTEPGLDSHRK